MATWNPDNVVLTNKGNEVLSKVQAGVGGLTVTRIVTGGTIIPYSQLYRCEDIPDIKQVCTILAKTTDRKGSEISVSVNNKDLKEEYALYTLGIYVTHPDFAGEILYLVAECDIEKPDLIPHPSVTIATMYYSLYMEHSNTDDITIIVNADGSLPLTGGQIDGDLTVIGKLKTSTEPVDPDDVVNKQALDLAMQGISSDSVIEQNKRLPQKFWRGTKAEYDAIENKDESVLYIVTDEQSGACPYYTKEEIDARLSGENLLINPRFKINQKGQDTYTSSSSLTYFIDKWMFHRNGGQYDVATRTLTMSAGAWKGISQRLKVEDVGIKNREVTFSLMYSASIPTRLRLAGIRYAGSEGASNVTIKHVSVPAHEGFECYQVTCIVPDDIEYFDVQLINGMSADTPAGTAQLVAAKLELGSVQTLASKSTTGEWVLNDPDPDYATELVKCQRYAIGGILEGTRIVDTPTDDVFEYFFFTPVSLRIAPTIATLEVITNTGVANPIEKTVINTILNNNGFYVNVSLSDFTADQKAKYLRARIPAGSIADANL